MQRKKKAKGKEPFANDAPKLSVREDSLGRSRFAEKLARDLRSWTGNDALVTGLAGSWGTGKTSLKNFTLELLNRRRTTNRIQVIEFNPWQLSGHGSLTASFFADLETVFTPGQEEERRNLREMSSRLRGLGLLGKPLAKILKGFGFAAPLLGGDGGDGFIEAGEAAEQASNFLSDTAQVANFDEKKQAVTLHDLKENVSEAMMGRPNPSLVIIDDIDRLSMDEIREVFQLVRVNADFPNLIFLLLFDREIVSKALDGITGERGDEFLEKIVPVLYEVPAIPKKVLENRLLRESSEILGGAEEMTYAERSRFSELWRCRLSRYFRHPRDVTRFLNSFRMTVHLLSSEGGFEVNQVDVFAIEVFRVHDYPLFRELQKVQTILCSSSYQENEGDDQHSSRLPESLEHLERLSCLKDSKGLFEALQNLFPLALLRYVSGSSDFRRDKRICHEDYFQRYFTLALYDEELSVFEVSQFIEAMYNPAQAIRLFNVICQRDLAKDLLEELWARIADLDLRKVAIVIESLSDLCEAAPPPDEKAFLIEGFSHAANRFLCLVMQRLEQSDRITPLLEGFGKSSGFQLLALAAWNHDGKSHFNDTVFLEEKNALKFMNFASERNGTDLSEGWGCTPVIVFFVGRSRRG